jgi:hypothetical protein
MQKRFPQTVSEWTRAKPVPTVNEGLRSIGNPDVKATEADEDLVPILIGVVSPPSTPL